MEGCERQHFILTLHSRDKHSPLSHIIHALLSSSRLSSSDRFFEPCCDLDVTELSSVYEQLNAMLNSDDIMTYDMVFMTRRMQKYAILMLILLGILPCCHPPLPLTQHSSFCTQQQFCLHLRALYLHARHS